MRGCGRPSIVLPCARCLTGPRRRREMRGAWDVAHPFESANSLLADGCGKLRTWQTSPPKERRRYGAVAAAVAAEAWDFAGPGGWLRTLREWSTDGLAFCEYSLDLDCSDKSGYAVG